MMDFRLKGHDLIVAKGDFMLCDNDKDAIAQNIIVRLKTLAKEWFMDQNIGVPYLSAIFGHKRSEHFVRELISQEILNIVEVQELKDFTARMSNDRTLYIKFLAILNDNSIININDSMGV